MHDIIFCSLPYSDLDHIYSAPAILKGVAMANGYQARTKDFGLMLFDICNRDKVYFDRVQSYFLGMCDDQDVQQTIERFYSECINWLQNNPSRFIGLSVLSIYTQRCVYELSAQIREKLSNASIVIGGRGCKVTLFPALHAVLNPTAREKICNFAEFLEHRNLADQIVLGDGEEAVIEVLQRVAITSKTYHSDTFRYPVPDYQDYEFDSYLTSETILPVTGSKGCVKDCDFCDVKFQFGKYRYRSGQDIAQEMIDLNQKYGVRKFQFTDSLVNGGMKSFREFVETMAAHNDLLAADRRITWSGQYICRPADQITPDIYEAMARSGAEGLTIGVESGSNQVLRAMNKKTTVEALYQELENFSRHGITCMLLTFVGHWSETWQDFVDHCRMFVKIMPWVRDGTVSAVHIGATMMMLDGTPAMFDLDHNNLVLSDFNQHFIWHNKSNASNTLKERLRRHLIVHRLCEILRIPTTREKEAFMLLTSIVEKYQVEINEFYNKPI